MRSRRITRDGTLRLPSEIVVLREMSGVFNVDIELFRTHYGG